MISRVGSYTFTSQNTRRLLNAQQQLFNLQTQVATGKRSQDYMSIAKDTRQIINLETQVENANQYIQQNSRTDLKLEAYNAAIEALTELAYEAKSLYNNSVSSGAEPADQVFDPRDRAYALLKEVEAQLNLKIDNDYLFGGGKVDTKPVSFPNSQTTLESEVGNGGTSTGPAFELNTGSPATFTSDSANLAYFYNGDNIDLTDRIDDDVEIDYAMRANESGFVDLMEALVVMIDDDDVHPGATFDADKVDFVEARLVTAIEELQKHAQKLGFAASQLERKNAELETFVTFTQNEIGEMQDIDPTEAIVKLQETSLNLEISYQATARINQLSIANYI
jgi:flagellin-like hook-associated protein FlgL